MSAAASPSSDTPWDMETDVLVIGSGAGGLAASLFAGLAGLDVILCEKQRRLGGTTATSGGGIWVPGTRGGLAAGDSKEKAKAYLQHLLGKYYRADLVDTYLETGSQVIDYLNDHTEVKFEVVPWPDYRSDEPGGAPKGRTLFPLAFDGKKLGKDFQMIQPPMHRLMVLGGLMLAPSDVNDFLHPFSSWGSFTRVTRKVLQYAIDRLRYSRGTDLKTGNALVARLVYSLPRDKTTILTESPMTELITENGAVVGAVVSVKGQSRRILARRGVVLATGGYPHNQEMLRKYGPTTPHRFSLCSAANVGEGIQAALKVGAVVDEALSSVGNWTPASVTHDSQGREVPVIYGYLDRGRPGVIAVNSEGKRFVNESNSYHDIVTALFATRRNENEAFHFVTDQAFVRRHGLGLVRPWPWNRSLKPWVRKGYIKMADTLPELASQIGVDPDSLVATVKRHNEFARTGVDLDFGKGSTKYNRMFGHQMEWPNPNLAPIESPPYVALRIHPATIGTTKGLKTTAAAQAVSATGEPIRGLYACGNDLAAVFRGYYPGGGTTLGPAIVFAYLAVQNMVGKSPLLEQLTPTN